MVLSCWRASIVGENRLECGVIGRTHYVTPILKSILVMTVMPSLKSTRYMIPNLRKRSTLACFEELLNRVSPCCRIIFLHGRIRFFPMSPRSPGDIFTTSHSPPFFFFFFFLLFSPSRPLFFFPLVVLPLSSELSEFQASAPSRAPSQRPETDTSRDGSPLPPPSSTPTEAMRSCGASPTVLLTL